MGQLLARGEAAGHLLQGGSALLEGAHGMGRTTMLTRLVAVLQEKLVGGLFVEVEARPAENWTALAANFRRALIRAVRSGAADTVLAELGVNWEDDEREHATGPGGLEAGLQLCERMLEDAAEAGFGVVLVVDGLRGWLSVADGDADGAEAVGAWLRHRLERSGTAGLHLLAADEPDVAVETGAALRQSFAAVERVPLDPLSQDEVTELLAAVAPELDEKTAAYLYRMVGGHPRLVNGLAQHFARATARRGALDEQTRVALTGAVDGEVAEVVRHGIDLLRRTGAERVIDHLFAAAVTADAETLDAGQVARLWPLGLLDADERLPERIRAEVARGAAVARTRVSGSDETAEDPAGVEAAAPTTEVDLDLGRKERLLFNYLKNRPGEPVPWRELAAAYFPDQPGAVQDEAKSLRTLRAAVNRINAKLAPTERAARGGWKVVRYARGRGFYVERDALESVLH